MAKTETSVAKYIGCAIAVLVLMVASLLAGFALDAEPDYSNYVEVGVYDELDEASTTLQGKYDALLLANNVTNELNKYYEDEYSESESEHDAYDILSDWTEDNYLDELDLDDDDYEDFSFELDLEKWGYAEYDEDNGDITVTIEGEIEWDDGDNYGEWNCTIVGEIEEDGDLDDEEIECDIE